MRSLLRFVAGAAAALALNVPVSADEQTSSPEPPAAASASPAPAPFGLKPLRPSAVVVRIDGGFHPENRWLWYDADGTARFEGVLAADHGRFRSHVDYKKVEQILTDAGMCTRHATIVRPAGMDMFTYHVSVRCGNQWRFFTSADAFEPQTVAQTRAAVRGLERLAANLTWEKTNDNVGPPG